MTKAAILLAGLMFLAVSCTTSKVSTGEKAEIITLPDGSVMILNEHSAARYVVNDNTRNVELTGEAFFSIKKADIPFEVHTSNGVIVVLGTEFNVHSQENELEVEVDNGLVEVETKNGIQKLKRGERIVYDDVKKLAEKSKASFKHHIWTDDFKDDMRQLGKELKKESKKLGREINKVSKDFKIKL